MDLRSAAAVAKQQIGDLFAAEAPQDVRLEQFLYDDHLGVWSLTIGFVLTDGGERTRRCKIVRVSEADQSVLSVADP